MSNFKFDLFQIQEVLNPGLKKINLNNSECIAMLSWSLNKLRLYMKSQSKNFKGVGKNIPYENF